MIASSLLRVASNTLINQFRLIIGFVSVVQSEEVVNWCLMLSLNYFGLRDKVSLVSVLLLQG